MWKGLWSGWRRINNLFTNIEVYLTFIVSQNHMVLRGYFFICFIPKACGLSVLKIIKINLLTLMPYLCYIVNSLELPC